MKRRVDHYARMVVVESLGEDRKGNGAEEEEENRESFFLYVDKGVR